MVLVLLITLTSYLQTQKLPGFLHVFVESQLLRAGIAAKFEEIRVDIWRGILAEQVVLADAKRPEQVLARVDEVALRLNWLRLAQGKSVITGLRIANARVAVPTPADEQGLEFFTADEAYARLSFGDDDTVRLDQLTGVYCGIRLNVAGSIKLLSAADRSVALQRGGRASRPGQFLFITKALRELSRIQVKETPQMDVGFDVDLADPVLAKVRANLVGREIGYRGVRVDKMDVQLRMEDGALDIPTFNLALYGGEVTFGGRYDFANGMFDLKLKSTTDPTAFAVVLPEKMATELRKLVVVKNPSFALRYHLSAETGIRPRLEGWIDAPPFRFQDVAFTAVRAKFDMTHPVAEFREVLVAMPDGQVTGHGRFHVESTDFEYEIDSTLNPTELLKFMPPMTRRVVEPARFAKSPHLVASVRGDFIDPDNFAYDATLSADACQYRGVRLAHASARLRLRDGRLDVRDLVVRGGGGEVTGRLLADFNVERTEFDVAGTSNPVELAPLLGPKAAAWARRFQVDVPCRAEAVGVADFADPVGTAWKADVAAGYFGHKNLAICGGAGRLVFTNDTLAVSMRAESGGWDRMHGSDVAVEALVGKDAGSLTVDARDVTWQTMSAGDVSAMIDVRGREATGWARLVNGAWGGLTAESATVDFMSSPASAFFSVDAERCRLWLLDGARVSADVEVTRGGTTAAVAVEDLKWWKLHSNAARADVMQTGKEMRVDNIRADFYDGSMEGAVDLRFDEEETRYRVGLRVRDGNVQTFARRYHEGADDMYGTFGGRIEIEGEGSSVESVDGVADMQIKDAMLLELPFLGVFSRVLNSITRGLGSIKITEATADMTIEDGTVKTDNLTMRAGAFTLTSRGEVDPKGNVDFLVQARLLKQVPILNIPGWFLGKMFEYKIGGTVGDPNYRPVMLPKEIMPHGN
jgi:hypothetical protein